MAEQSGQLEPVQLPWKNTPDEIVVNLATGSLRESMLGWLKTERGVHAETLMVAIGALAGFAGQNAVWTRIAKRDVPLPPGADKSISGEALYDHLRDSGLFVVGRTKSGEIVYRGDLINGYLVEQPGTLDVPLWSLVAGTAVNSGIKPAELPELKPIFRYVAGTLGKPEFGVARAPDGHTPQLTSRQALDLFWPRAKFIFSRTDGQGGVEAAKGRSVPPEYWPLITALVAQQFVTMTKDTLDPRIGLALLMESAIAMSKVDPKTVPQTVSDQKPP